MLKKTEKLISQLGQWNEKREAWASDNIVMNPYCIVYFNENVDGVYSEIHESFRKYIDTNLSKERENDLEIPSAADLKTQIKDLVGNKRSIRTMYCFGDGQPVVNAKYLLQLIEGLNITEGKYSDCRSIVEFTGEYGTAYLLPIQKPTIIDTGCYTA